MNDNNRFKRNYKDDGSVGFFVLLLLLLLLLSSSCSSPPPLLYSTPLKRKKRRERDDVVWCIDAADEIMKCFSLSRQFRPPGVDEQEQILLALSPYTDGRTVTLCTLTQHLLFRNHHHHFFVFFFIIKWPLLYYANKVATQRSLLLSFLPSSFRHGSIFSSAKLRGFSSLLSLLLR